VLKSLNEIPQVEVGTSRTFGKVKRGKGTDYTGECREILPNVLVYKNSFTQKETTKKNHGNKVGKKEGGS